MDPLRDNGVINRGIINILPKKKINSGELKIAELKSELI
jgi:hypothetical protein